MKNNYSYKNEALDSKLCLLRFMKYFWIVMVATLLGALSMGGIYFLKNIAGASRQYRVEDEYYVKYALQESGEEYVYFNQMTWSNLSHTDYFVSAILNNMKTPISVEELESYIDATLLSDTRIVTTTVTTPKKELTLEIHDAYMDAFMGFSDQYQEIESIKVIKTGQDAKLVALDDRTYRAAMLGAVLFFVISGYIVYMYVVMDDSIYLPISLEKRTGIPTYSGKDTGYVLEPGCTEAVVEKMEDAEESTRQEEKSYVLLTLAGKHNGTRIEKILSDASKEKKRIVEAYLLGEDEKLIMLYYGMKK